MNDLKDKLYEDLPSESISQHPTKKYLNSIKAIYVTDRFNEVFGVGKWTIRVEKEHVNHETGMVIVKVIFEVPESKIYYESFGGNDNGSTDNKNFDLGDAYKGASTDAITKIGSYMGVGIKVFKGKSSDKTHVDDGKKWLNPNTVDWNNAVSKKVDIKEVIKYYKISKENQEKYLKEIK